jgi:hypothetical protein
LLGKRYDLEKGYPEFNESQARGADGKWTSGGGGGGGAATQAQAQQHRSGWQRAGRAALIGGGVLAGAVIAPELASLALRPVSRRIFAARLAQRRAAATAYRRLKAQQAAREAAARSAALGPAGSLRATFSHGESLRRPRASRLTTALNRAERANAAATRAQRAAARHTIDKLPPKARARLRDALRQGNESPGEGLGHLPSLLDALHIFH